MARGLTQISAERRPRNPRKSAFIRVQIGFSLLLGKRHKLELHMVKLRESVFQHPAKGGTLNFIHALDAPAAAYAEEVLWNQLCSALNAELEALLRLDRIRGPLWRRLRRRRKVSNRGEFT